MRMYKCHWHRDFQRQPLGLLLHHHNLDCFYPNEQRESSLHFHQTKWRIAIWRIQRKLVAEVVATVAIWRRKSSCGNQFIQVSRFSHLICQLDLSMAILFVNLHAAQLYSTDSEINCVPLVVFYVASFLTEVIWKSIALQCVHKQKSKRCRTLLSIRPWSGEEHNTRR